MQARLKNPAALIPQVMEPMMTIAKATMGGKVPAKTLGLVHVRVSQINGCAVCLDLHVRQMKRTGETDDRLLFVSTWRESPLFSDAERAALALAEAETRLADQTDPVPDDVWKAAAGQYDDEGLAQLVLYVALVNVWNRVNVTTRQVPGRQSWE